MSEIQIGERIREIAARVARENDIELVHAEVAGSKKSSTVRIYIDKPGGVTHEDCTLVSKRVEEILDADDLIPLTYLLEVSSPGIERELYSLQDFEKFAGNLAKLKTHKPLNGQKNFRGKIVSVENAEIIFEDKTSGSVKIPYEAVAKANLEIDLDAELKRSGDK